jgi:hypothetical protein
MVFSLSNFDPRLRGKGIAECPDIADPAKERFDVKKRGLLGEGRASLMGGVFQHDAEILKEKAIAQCRFDANIGGDPGKHQMTNATAAQDAVQWGIKKPL